MDEFGEMLADDCVEVLVRSVETEEQSSYTMPYLQEVNGTTSFETLVRTALALEEDPRDEHSYAYSERKLALKYSKKDHCYSANSKYAHRKVQSLSDENIFLSAEDEDPTMLLPHYQSKDSALDVTGFDTISEKCLSYENIDLKTVDVFTDKCILPGLSDPDISRMTLQSVSDSKDFQKSLSLPNSPPSKDKLVLDHTYSTFSKIDKHMFSSNSKAGEQANLPCSDAKLADNTEDYNKSPLFDHSYDTNQKRRSLPCNAGMKRGRSNDKVNYFGRQFNFTSKDFTKSPFLDHTYQSVKLTNVGKKQNIDQKTERVCNSDKVYVGMRDEEAFPDEPAFLDHNYEVRNDDSNVDDIWFRSRSNSVSEINITSKPSAFYIKVNDHSYVVERKEDNCGIDERRSCSSELSDSGTESFNEEDEVNMSSTFDSLVTLHKDHAYVVTKNI